MNKNHRMIFEVVFSLLLISLMYSVMSVAKAESVNALSNDTKLISSASTNTPIQRSIWTLGIALVGGAVIFRRKSP